MAPAIDDVLKGKLSIRKPADKLNLKPATLQHRIEKKNNIDEDGNFSSKYTSKQIFTTEQEDHLNAYIIKCSKIS